jgi:hypothetical protein
VAETRRALLWGALLPLAIVLAALWRPIAVVLLGVYVLQWLRLGLRLSRQGSPIPWANAAFLLMGRFAEAQGALKFHLGRVFGRRSALIEYK